ncbi:unnamed protein product, partial [Rotaria magnacalcarata]
SSSLSSATTTAPTITNSIPNSSHPPSLLTNNDRSGIYIYILISN